MPEVKRSNPNNLVISESPHGVVDTSAIYPNVGDDATIGLADRLIGHSLSLEDRKSVV